MKPFSWIFADIPASGSNFFLLVKTDFSSNPSSRLLHTDFGLISNLALLFRAFFLLWKALLKLDVNQFSSIFLVPNSGSNFPASGNGFFIECYSFRRVETEFLSSVLLFRANFVLVETIIQFKVKAVSYRLTSLLPLEIIFYAFFHIDSCR